MNNIDAMRFIESGKRLAQPVNCPLSVYSVMLATWRHTWRDRPSFETLASAMDGLHRRALKGDLLDGAL